MKLINRIRHRAEKNRITHDFDILIYSGSIIWYMVETVQNRDGEEFTEDQPLDDYIKNGPPSFAEDIPDEILKEIERSIQRK